jgi:hypothetical protein
MQMKSIWTVTLLAIAAVLQPASNVQGAYSEVPWPTRVTEPAVSGKVLAFTSPDRTWTHIGWIEPYVTTYGKNPPIVVRIGDAAPAGGTFGWFGPARISGDTVAFLANFSGVFTKSGETITTIAKIGDLLPSPELPIEELGRDLAISQNRVAFSASYGGGSQQGIFAGSGGALTTIARTGDVSPAGTLAHIYDGPAIRGSTVAFAATIGDGTKTGIFVGNGGELTTIAVTGDPAPVGVFDTIDVAGISMGDSKVAFSASYDGGAKSGIFIGSGGPLTAIAQTGDVVAGFGPIESLRASAMSGSTVAFLADGPGGSGIFTSDDSGHVELRGVVNNMIAFPPMRTGPSMGRFGFDGNRLAFFYTTFTDGDHWIVTLTIPGIQIPEPATASLMLLSVAFLVTGRRRPRRRLAPICSPR